MGLCQYVDLCFHALSLPCLPTFWHAIPTSFYIFNVLSLVINIIHRPDEALDIQSELIFVNGMVHSLQE